MKLNKDQLKVLDETGNTFITGGAGVGKSFLINEIKAMTYRNVNF